MDDDQAGVPRGAIGALNGLFFKIGRHNLAYYWNGEEWMRSERSAKEVRVEIDNKRHKFLLAH